MYFDDIVTTKVTDEDGDENEDDFLKLIMQIGLSIEINDLIHYYRLKDDFISIYYFMI